MDGLIIPGGACLLLALSFAATLDAKSNGNKAAGHAGESTTMALVAERWGLIPVMKTFAAEGRPIWGTCAGLIFLADRAKGQQQGAEHTLQLHFQLPAA